MPLTPPLIRKRKNKTRGLPQLPYIKILCLLSMGCDIKWILDTKVKLEYNKKGVVSSGCNKGSSNLFFIDSIGGITHENLSE